MQIQINGAELCVDTTGDPSHPAVLLVMGAAGSMDRWEDGGDDPLFPPAHGEALAREIPGATLLIIDGLGHEFPGSAWDEALPAMVILWEGANARGRRRA